MGIERIHICNRCKEKVYPSEIKWYSFECDNCDESLFSFETTKI